jgi:hypothetical protein
MSKTITAPEPLDFWNWIGKRSIFLAGSIEMGVAEEWQTKVIKELEDLDVIILNPRRKDWDASWKQSIEDKNFYEQVTWEQDGLLKWSDFIFFYFAPDTKAPISLMELGMVAGLHNVRKIVVCPDGFWRKGNIEVLCHRFNIPVYNTIDDGVAALRNNFPHVIETLNGPYGFMGQ